MAECIPGRGGSWWPSRLPRKLVACAGCCRGLLQLSQLRLGLFERNVLHQNGLGEDIKRIWIGAKFFVKQGFGVGIFLLQLGLVNALGERVDELFFLGSHVDKPPAAGNGGMGCLSGLRRMPAVKVAPPG